MPLPPLALWRSAATSSTTILPPLALRKQPAPSAPRSKSSSDWMGGLTAGSKALWSAHSPFTQLPGGGGTKGKGVG